MSNQFQQSHWHHSDWHSDHTSWSTKGAIASKLRLKLALKLGGGGGWSWVELVGAGPAGWSVVVATGPICGAAWSWVFEAVAKLLRAGHSWPELATWFRSNDPSKCVVNRG